MEHCLRNPLIMVEACKNGAGDHHEGDDDDDDDDLVDSSISSSFSGVSSGSSSIESDSFEEEVTSNPLSDMSSLLQQLPIKRGLSRHYDGKSQSFTSLASVRSLEDLAKHPEIRRRRNANNSNQNLKCCRRIRSYGGGRLMCSSSHSTMNALSRHICKREWHSSNNSRNIASSSLNFMGTRPPIPPPHRSTTTISTQTPLFV